MSGQQILWFSKTIVFLSFVKSTEAFGWHYFVAVLTDNYMAEQHVLT